LTDVLCDLDGVIYRGDSILDGAPGALKRLYEAGHRVTFVTNNSTRTPQAAAVKVQNLTGIQVNADQMATSSQAAASILGDEDSPVFVVGEEGVSAAILDQGLELTGVPSEARSVVVGMYWGVTYRDIAEASDAVRRGARFVATNNDPTYPVEGGLLPGAGALVAAIATAAGRSPELAGKPNPPMTELLLARGIESAWVVGDRIDTDIALAKTQERWESIFVETGVNTAKEAEGEADNSVPDFAAAVDLILSRPNQA